ncbi:hypothetical protein QG37_08041 [Candidozyma auris]|nr:hypothetical protein QG37_08041 [[Candida] auris]
MVFTWWNKLTSSFFFFLPCVAQMSKIFLLGCEKSGKSLSQKILCIRQISVQLKMIY